MAITAQRLMVEVDADTARAERNLAAVGREGGRIPSWAGVASKAVAGLGAALGTYFGAKAILGGGMTRLMNIEDAQAKLRGLGHDTETVAQVMRDADAAVTGTAFALDTAATVAGSAMAAGVKEGAELERYLTLVADAAVIAGAGMDEMGSVINKVTASGKAQMDNINQLQDRGIPIMQWLADEYGVSAAELSKMVSQGKVDSETFLAAIENNIGGAAQSAGDTTRGAFANMRTAFSRTGALLLEGVFPMFREAFLGITNGVKSLAPHAEALGQAFGDWVSGTALPAVQGLLGAIAAEGPGVLALFSPLGAILRGALPALQEVGGSLALIGEAIGGVLAQVLPVAAEAFAALAEAVGGALGAALPAVAEVLTEVARVIPMLTPPLLTLVPLIADLLVGMVNLVAPLLANADAIKIIAGAIALWVAGTKALAAYRGAVMAVTAAKQAYAFATYGQITATSGLLPRLAAVTGAVVTQTKAVASTVAAWGRSAAAAVAASARTVASWVAAGAAATANAARMAATMAATAARTVAGWVLMGAQSLIQAARMAAAWVIAMGPVGWIIAAVVGLVALIIANWDTIREATVAAWTAITEWISNAWDTIVGWVTTAVENVRAVIDRVFGVIKALVTAYVTAWRTVITTAWNAIRSAVTAVVEAVRAVIDRVFGVIRTLVTTYVNAWRTVITTAWNAIRSAVSTAVNAVKSIIDGLASIVGKVREWFGNVKSAIVDRFTEAVAFVKGIPGKIIGALGNVSTLLKDSGRKIIQGLINGITGMAGKVKDAVTGVLNRVRNLLPFSPAKEGPFSGKGWTLYSGRSIPEALAKGITDRVDQVRRAALGMATAASAPLNVAGAPPAAVAHRAVAQTPSAAPSGPSLPDTITLVDRDGTFLGRMQVEAGKVVSGQVTPLHHGKARWT